MPLNLLSIEVMISVFTGHEQPLVFCPDQMALDRDKGGDMTQGKHGESGGAPW